MKTNKKLSLTAWIFLALVLGIAAGLLLRSRADLAETYIRPFGTIFLNLVRFIVVPIVLFSIMNGILSMRDIKKIGSVGAKTVLFYLVTTALAVILGLAVGNLFKGLFPALQTTSLTYEAPAPVSFMNTFVDLFPSNVIAPIYTATMLQIIAMALFFGFAILLAGEVAAPAVRAVACLNAIFSKCMELILRLSPVGVFAMICSTVASNGAAILGSLASVLLAAYLCYAVHMAAVYSLAVGTLGGLSPIAFFREQLPAMIFAFSSASSVGTIPINLRGCEKMGADPEVTAFVLPLGATINMDGTAIYQGVCTVFIAACYGIDLTLGQTLTVIATATLASIGTAGVPGAGVLMLAMVLTSVGLPVEGIALVAGVDRIFDMGRTVVNITGDAACAVVVSHLRHRKQR